MSIDTTEVGRRPLVSPITDSELHEVGEFLHEHLNPRLSASSWASGLAPQWDVAGPNHGFQLRADGRVVGVYAAIYSKRIIRGKAQGICNLAAWCVLEPYRSDGLRLVRAILRQQDYTFTDLSPSGNVIALNSRLGFESLDETTYLAPNLPSLAWPSSGRVVDSPAEVESALAGADLQIFRDHMKTTGARHVLLKVGSETCYVIFRRERRKNLPLFASVLYVSNKTTFRKGTHGFQRYLFLRHHVLVSLMELRIIGKPPKLSFRQQAPRTKMFRSSEVDAADIDYLYSELTCIAW